VAAALSVVAAGLDRNRRGGVRGLSLAVEHVRVARVVLQFPG
jgi:hypothetical protein